MKAAIITVAGMSTRFNKSLDEPCLKCIYTKSGKEQTLLYNLLKNCSYYDQVIVVGGYQFKSLFEFIQNCPLKLKKTTRIIENPDYDIYGSGYSFYLGLLALQKEKVNEITLIEGDLFVDRGSMQKIQDTDGDIISICREPVYSDRSVAIYMDMSGHLHYLYQQDHKAFHIHEAFTAIFSSAQIWKFSDADRLFKIAMQLSDTQLKGTNLEMVQAYFGGLERGQYEIICTETWINCNTTEDYKQIAELMEESKYDYIAGKTE